MFTALPRMLGHGRSVRSRYDTSFYVSSSHRPPPPRTNRVSAVSHRFATGDVEDDVDPGLATRRSVVELAVPSSPRGLIGVAGFGPRRGEGVELAERPCPRP